VIGRYTFIMLTIASLFIVPVGVKGDGEVALSILSPTSSEVLSGEVEFVISVSNPSELTLSLSLEVSGDGSSWDVLVNEQTDIPSGTVELIWNSSVLDNGAYRFRARADHSMGHDLSSTLGPLDVFTPSIPNLRWLAPARTSKVSGTYRFSVNVTGDHGGLAANPLISFREEGSDQWRLLGVCMKRPEGTVFDLDFDTFSLEDGDHYFRVNATSVHGLYSEAVVGPVVLDNQYPPSVTIASPEEGAVLTGSVVLTSTAIDPDDDIDDEGVAYFYSRQGADLLTRIAGVPSGPGRGILWDTRTVPNGPYKVTALVRDRSTPPISASDIRNVSVANPPIVEDIRSMGSDGDSWGLEVEIAQAPMAYPLSIRVFADTGRGYRLAGSANVPSEGVVAGPLKVRIAIATAGFPETMVSIRAEVTDSYDVVGSLERRDLFLFRALVRPRVRVLPSEGPLVGNATVRAEVIDDDAPLRGPVRFYYSTDNTTWIPLGNGSFDRDNIYGAIWNTLLVRNFTDYHIKVAHTDSDGLTGEGYLGDFEVRNPPPGQPPQPERRKAWYETADGIMSVLGTSVLISAFLAIVVALVVGLSRRASRRREALRRQEEEKERLKRRDTRARDRDRELRRLMEVGSKFTEPQRRSAPRGEVPLKPAEMGIRRKDDILKDDRKVRITEYEEAPVREGPNYDRIP